MIKGLRREKKIKRALTIPEAWLFKVKVLEFPVFTLLWLIFWSALKTFGPKWSRAQALTDWFTQLLMAETALAVVAAFSFGCHACAGRQDCKLYARCGCRAILNHCWMSSIHLLVSVHSDVGYLLQWPSRAWICPNCILIVKLKSPVCNFAITLQAIMPIGIFFSWRCAYFPKFELQLNFLGNGTVSSWLSA